MNMIENFENEIETMMKKSQHPEVTCLIIEPLVAREVGKDVVEDLELAAGEHLVQSLAHGDHDDELQVHRFDSFSRSQC